MAGNCVSQYNTAKELASIITNVPDEVFDLIAAFFKDPLQDEEQDAFLTFANQTSETRRAALRILRGHVSITRHTDPIRWSLFSNERLTSLSISYSERMLGYNVLPSLVKCQSLTSLSLRGCASLISSVTTPLKRLTLLVSRRKEIEPVRDALRRLAVDELDLTVRVPVPYECSLHNMRNALTFPSVRLLTLSCACSGLDHEGDVYRSDRCIAIEIAARQPNLERFTFRFNSTARRVSTETMTFIARLGFLFHDVTASFFSHHTSIEGTNRTGDRDAPPHFCFKNNSAVLLSPQRSVTLRHASTKGSHTSWHRQVCVDCKMRRFFRHAHNLSAVRLEGIHPYTGSWYIDRIPPCMWDSSLVPSIQKLHVTLPLQEGADIWFRALLHEIHATCTSLELLSINSWHPITAQYNIYHRGTEEITATRESLRNEWAKFVSTMPAVVVRDDESREPIDWHSIDSVLYGDWQDHEALGLSHL